MSKRKQVPLILLWAYEALKEIFNALEAMGIELRGPMQMPGAGPHDAEDGRAPGHPWRGGADTASAASRERTEADRENGKGATL